MENSQKVLQCYYCGNKTLMNKVGEHSNKEKNKKDCYISRIYSCPVCNRDTFTEESTHAADGSTANEAHEKIVYPVNSLTNSAMMPKNVKKAYEASLKVSKIDNATCLISLRRTLELICDHKQAKGANLQEKIKDLSTRNIFPATLFKLSNITRELGNDGAHTKMEISDHDLAQVAEFVKYILDYLYILPAKIGDLQKRMAIKEE